MNAYRCLCMCAYMSIYMYMYMHMSMSMSVYVYVYVYFYVVICRYLCGFVGACVYVHRCVLVGVSSFVPL